MSQRRKVAGFSLLELSIASALLSVGTLAVFTLTVHWRATPEQLNTRYDALQKAVLERPQPIYDRRFETLSCERAKD